MRCWKGARYSEIPKNYALINSKLQKSHSNAPLISIEITLLKDKFCLQSHTVDTFQREICCDETFKLLWAIPFNIHTPPVGRDFLRGSLNVISEGVTASAPLIF